MLRSPAATSPLGGGDCVLPAGCVTALVRIGARSDELAIPCCALASPLASRALFGVAISDLGRTPSDAVDQSGANRIELCEFAEVGGNIVGQFDGGQFGCGHTCAPRGDS